MKRIIVLLAAAFVFLGAVPGVAQPVPTRLTEETFGVVKLDRERIGADCINPCNRDLVIFVHGILGARETWKNSKTGADWPTLIAEDPDTQGFDIVRLDYTSLWFGGPAIEQVAADMHKAIESLDTAKYRTIQFVTHSLGGLLVRRYLLHVNSKHGHKHLSRFRLVIMLGTPGQGSYVATIADLALTNPQLRVLGPIAENDWLQMLNFSISDIRDKHTVSLCSSLQFLAAVETEGVGPIVVVGVRQSVNDADSYREFPRNHLSLVKPESRSDEVYTWAKARMLDCSRGRSCLGPHRSTMHADCGDREKFPEGR